MTGTTIEYKKLLTMEEVKQYSFLIFFALTSMFNIQGFSFLKEMRRSQLFEKL